MATAVQLRHRDSGVIKTGYFGFSWTTLFFGSFPALFRGDFLTFMGFFVIYVILVVTTFGIGAFVACVAWAFFYNGYYTKKLLERGYVFSDVETVNNLARMRLGVVKTT